MAILIRREQGFYRRLMKLSMPIVLQNLITFSLGLIDTFMVSQLGNTEMAAVTAAISALPRRPTMKVSAKPREVVMRFCSTMGSVSTQSLR